MPLAVHAMCLSRAGWIRQCGRVSASDNQAVSDLARKLTGRAAEPSEAEVGAGFDARIEACVLAADAGEPALALEDLASNLFEYDVDLALTEYDALERLAIRLGVPADRWDFLADLVRR